MYKSIVIVYSYSVSRNKAVLFVDKNRYYIVVILLVFKKIKILYYTKVIYI